MYLSFIPFHLSEMNPINLNQINPLFLSEDYENMDFIPTGWLISITLPTSKSLMISIMLEPVNKNMIKPLFNKFNENETILINKDKRNNYFYTFNEKTIYDNEKNENKNEKTIYYYYETIKSGYMVNFSDYDNIYCFFLDSLTKSITDFQNNNNRNKLNEEIYDVVNELVILSNKIPIEDIKDF